ncbi:MAG: hypothetical protein ABSG66_09430 [Stellaceae bacterium]|jgi:hypothetical protein
MTCIIDTKSKRRLPAKLAAGLAISALLVLGTFVASASADDHRGDRGDYRGDRGHGSCCYGGGYYAAPPVVYAPYYAPPPVVYGPGVYLPGLNINIR